MNAIYDYSTTFCPPSLSLFFSVFLCISYCAFPLDANSNDLTGGTRETGYPWREYPFPPRRGVVEGRSRAGVPAATHRCAVHKHAALGPAEGSQAAAAGHSKQAASASGGRWWPGKGTECAAARSCGGRRWPGERVDKKSIDLVRGSVRARVSELASGF